MVKLEFIRGERGLESMENALLERSVLDVAGKAEFLG